MSDFIGKEWFGIGIVAQWVELQHRSPASHSGALVFSYFVSDTWLSASVFGKIEDGWLKSLSS